MGMNESIARHLTDFPLIVPNAVDWGDMDAFGHVNNVVYFRWFENARIEYLRSVRFGDQIRPDGLGPILHSTAARYRVPIRYPDTAWTGARVTEVLDDRFSMEYRIVSGAAGAIAAEGTGLIVCYDYEKRVKAVLPPDLREAIAAVG